MDLPHDILLEGIAGSRAFGLATADSDTDIHGIYRAPIDDVLGLDPQKAVTNTWTHTNPDMAFHEVGKFINLALKCNPTVLELLWLNDYTTRTVEGNMLIEFRKNFLYERGVRDAYGGYARAQVHKLQSGTRPTAKMGRHAIRLLNMGEQLLSTGTMNIDCSEHRLYYFAMGELAVEDTDAYLLKFNKHLEVFENRTSVLPERNDRAAAEQLLRYFRVLSMESKTR